MKSLHCGADNGSRISGFQGISLGPPVVLWPNRIYLIPDPSIRLPLLNRQVDINLSNYLYVLVLVLMQRYSMFEKLPQQDM